MRKTTGGLLAMLGMLATSEAHAQFANRSLGAGLGFIKLLGDSSAPGATGVDFAVPLTLEGSMYLENGFDLYLHVPLLLLQVSSGAFTASGAGLVMGTGGHAGVRFLFSEETLRPYVGIELAGFYLFTKQPIWFIGPGVVLGLEYFVADTVAIGARGFFDLFIELNFSPRPSFGGGLSVAFYF